MIILYECDPEKNTQCRKISCTIHKVCYCTRDPEYAKKDENGDPIVAYARTEGQDKDQGMRIRIEKKEEGRA